MASRSFRMDGSGTSCTSTLFGLIQQLAFMPAAPSARRRTEAAPGVAGTPGEHVCPTGLPRMRFPPGAPPGSPALPVLDDLLEPAEVVVEMLGRVLTEVLGQCLPQT